MTVEPCEVRRPELLFLVPSRVFLTCGPMGSHHTASNQHQVTIATDKEQSCDLQRKGPILPGSDKYLYSFLFLSDAVVSKTRSVKCFVFVSV